jgi:hypothetical protein
MRRSEHLHAEPRLPARPRSRQSRCGRPGDRRIGRAGRLTFGGGAHRDAHGRRSRARLQGRVRRTRRSRRAGHLRRLLDAGADRRRGPPHRSAGLGGDPSLHVAQADPRDRPGRRPAHRAFGRPLRGRGGRPGRGPDGVRRALPERDGTRYEPVRVCGGDGPVGDRRRRQDLHEHRRSWDRDPGSHSSHPVRHRARPSRHRAGARGGGERRQRAHSPRLRFPMGAARITGLRRDRRGDGHLGRPRNLQATDRRRSSRRPRLGVEAVTGTWIVHEWTTVLGR